MEKFVFALETRKELQYLGEKYAGLTGSRLESSLKSINERITTVATYQGQIG